MLVMLVLVEVEWKCYVSCWERQNLRQKGEDDCIYGKNRLLGQNEDMIHVEDSADDTKLS